MLVKKLVLTDQCCSVVSRKTGLKPEEVRAFAIQWFNQGRSVEYIRQAFIWIALSRGKRLCFVNGQGRN